MCYERNVFEVLWTSNSVNHAGGFDIFRLVFRLSYSSVNGDVRHCHPWPTAVDYFCMAHSDQQRLSLNIFWNLHWAHDNAFPTFLKSTSLFSNINGYIRPYVPNESNFQKNVLEFETWRLYMYLMLTIIYTFNAPYFCWARVSTNRSSALGQLFPFCFYYFTLGKAGVGLHLNVVYMIYLLVKLGISTALMLTCYGLVAVNTKQFVDRATNLWTNLADKERTDLLVDRA